MKQVLASAICLFIVATKTYTQQAEVIYKTYCGGCHGARLEGNSAPKLIKDKWQHGSTHSAILKVLNPVFQIRDERFRQCFKSQANKYPCRFYHCFSKSTA
jgi:hypothetical protein